MASTRPFYGSFAWAYDDLSQRPVAQECRFVAAALAARGIGPGASLLDAGCGTGRYAVELARLGYGVVGVDRSLELLVVATGRAVATTWFVVADLGALPLRRGHDAALCRGVLNDVLDDGAREAVIAGLAAVLRAGGVLVLDVRDWDATVARKLTDPVYQRTVETARGMLTFQSETRLEPATRSLRVAERHVLAGAGGTQTESYDFVMRCWTADELLGRLTEAGFEAVVHPGGYDDTAAPGSSDRLVAVAVRRR